MSYFKNKGFWFWAFLALLIFNLSVFGSMAYHMYQYHNGNLRNGAFHSRMKKGAHAKHRQSTQSFIKQLHLSEQQQEELGSIRKEHFKKVKGLKRNLMKVQHQLFDEAGRDKVDSTKLEEYRNQMMRLQGAIADESIIFLGKLKKHLSPEQQELMKQHFQMKYQKDNHTQNNN